MKKLIITTMLITFYSSGLNFQLSAQTANDSLSIRNTCLNYIEGWYEGDAARMEKALHPNLVKRRIATLKQTEGNIIDQVTAIDMIEYTKAGFGKKDTETALKLEIKIMGIHKGIANVTAISNDFVDYIHVAKFNDEWKIMNVLWEMAK